MKWNLYSLLNAKLCKLGNFPAVSGELQIWTHVGCVKINTAPETIFHWLRRMIADANNGLLSYYRICHRIGFELQLSETRTIDLLADEVIRLNPDSEAKQIEVIQGIIWLTGSPADGDVLVHAGGGYALTGHRPFIVQALGPARIILRK